MVCSHLLENLDIELMILHSLNKIWISLGGAISKPWNKI